MPSFFEGILSEPVKLDASDASAYDPPHRPSTEKRTSYSSGVTESGIWQFTNGSPIEPLSNRKLPNGRPSIENSRNEASYHTLMNGRSSGSTHSTERTDAKNESSHSLAQQIMRNLDSSQSAPRPSIDPSRQTTAKPLSASDTPKKPNDTPSSKPKQPEIPTSVQSGTQPNAIGTTMSPSPIRHRRAQSASNSQGPSTLSVSNSEQQVNETTAQPPNRFSSPPLYPPSDGKTGSSSTLQHPGIARLQHRHTLQVPRASTGRGSRDFSWSHGSGSEDAISSSVSQAAAGARRGSLSLVRRTTRSLQSDLFLGEEVPQDGDVERWTETVKQKRMSRRKRKEEEEDDRVIVGTKVDQHHVNWVTAYNMLTGIRFTVSRTNAKIDRDLTDADFDARHKFSFDITGNELTPSAKYDFKFKDYAPWVFRHLRNKFRLDPADYLISLTSKYILSELGSPGKSGSFFYFSRDYKYIIKTIHHAEHKLLRKILREYYAHVEQNPNTLISQFYGLHRVKIPYGKKIHFVVMNNLFPAHRDIHQTFDLKGSTVGRNFREEELAANPRATLKDLNWLRRNYHLEFGPQKKSLFVEQMRRDVALLQKLKIMDYSLLVGIHDVNKGNEENLRDKTLQVFQPGVETGQDAASSLLLRTPSKLENARKARELRHIIKNEKPVPIDQTIDRMPEQLQGEKKDFLFYSDDGGIRATHEDGQPGEEIYYLGIIDCLTHYGLVKKAEHFWKGMSANKSQISPIPPEGYGERFVKFITGITMTTEESDRIAADGNHGADGSHRQSYSHLSRSSTDRVMEKAEKQARKAEDQGMTEDGVPADRTLGAVRSPSAERTAGVGGATLPIVDEAGEGASTGGRSGRSGMSHESLDEDSVASGPQTPNGKATSGPPLGGRPPPTPPKDHPVRGRRSSGKRLPDLPVPQLPALPRWQDGPVELEG